MGQYYKALTKNDKENLNWSIQSTRWQKSVESGKKDYDESMGIKLMEHSWIGNQMTDAMSQYLYKNPSSVKWIGDYADESDDYYLLWGENSLPDYNYEPLDENFDYTGLWCINWTKRVAFRFPEYNRDNWNIYPISLLTSDGNGRGGGDYWGQFSELCGTWRGDVISLDDAMPDGFTEIEPPGFKE